MKYLGVFLLVTFLVSNIKSQTVGSFYRMESETGELTKKVNVWGYVKNPGRYEVPVTTNLIQLIAYAGGPREYAVLDEIKLYRNLENGKQLLKEINVEDPAETPPADLILNNEDTIVIDYSSAVTIRDIFSYIGAPIALIASVVLIIDRINR